MSNPIDIPTKAVKVTIPIELAAFPLDQAPPPGTPGAKSRVFEYRIQYAGGTLGLTLKGAQLQKLAAAVQAAPQPGGFVVIQGKLGPDATLIEAGAIFQPGQPKPAAA